MKPSNKVLADRLKRDEWGQKMYRPNGGEFVTSHKHGVVGEAYDEMLDGLNYLYRAQSERALAARSLVHLAADLLAAEIMELEALGTTIDERNRMELTADTETGKDQRIAALKAQLAEANERCAELAAALDRLRKNALEMAGYVKPYGLDDAGPQSEWSRYIQCRSNIENGTDPTAILAAVREEARRKGRLEEVRAMKSFEPNYNPPHDPGQGRHEQYDRGRRETWAEFEDEFDRRIAALEAQG